MKKHEKVILFPLIVMVAIVGGVFAWFYECLVICLPATIGAIIKTVRDMYEEDK